MSDPFRVQMSGPLSVFAAGFRDELEGRGYRPDTVAKQLQLMAHLSRWLAAHELELAALDSVRIAKFVAERRTSHTHLAVGPWAPSAAGAPTRARRRSGGGVARGADAGRRAAGPLRGLPAAAARV